jgi:4-hydroxybenzoate polyprenyltransferase
VIVAAIAGTDGVTAVRLGVAMTSLQASIGSLNDLVDAPRDVGRTPAKPIPGGLVSRPVAWSVVATTAVVGVALSIPSGPVTAALAVVVLGIGYAYDVRFKGTAWSWVPFAVGIPLLPAYGWLGTTGGGVFKSVNAGESWAPVTDKGQAASLMKLVEAIEDLEDVQNVYMNGDIADEALEG